MVEYKLKFYSIKSNENVIKHFDNKEEMLHLYGLLLGHKYIKDLVAFKYDRKNRKYGVYKI